MPEPDLPAAPASVDVPELPMLRGELVWLRGVQRADFVDHTLGVNDRETGHLMGLKLPIGPDDAGEFATKILAQQGKTQWNFAICPIGTSRGIGNVGLRNVDRENGSAELTIVIADKAFHGRGYGTDAVHLICDFGFGELRLERIYLHVFDYNPRAIRSYEKAGFRTDAVLRHARFHRGEHHDVHLMAILRDDWLASTRRRGWDDPAPGA